MRILIATPLLPSQSGGPAQYAVGLKQFLEAKGCQVDTVAFQEVVRYPTLIRHAILFFKICLRVSGADAIIVLDTFSMALPAVIAGVLFRKKVVVRVGGDFVWEQYIEHTKEKVRLSDFYRTNLRLSWKERLALWLQKNIVVPLTDVLVFSTEWQRDIWLVPYRLSRVQVSIVENAYLPDMGGISSSEDTRTVIWIGRDITLKNVDMLDRAVELVKKKIPTLEYEKYSSISHEEVIRALARSRLLVIPSISEVSPNLVLEALALRVPVLLTEDCGLREALGQAVTWVDSRSAEALATRIEELSTDEGYRAARERASAFKSTRTYDNVADEFLTLLR